MTLLVPPFAVVLFFNLLLFFIGLHLPILLRYDDLPVHHPPQHAHALGGKLQARLGDLDLGQRIFPAMLSRFENA
ncbi:hypothetical protein A2U01_0081728, partial [Trifolium medium]|nr:hypothetical protein [Trifolium medium]